MRSTRIIRSLASGAIILMASVAGTAALAHTGLKTSLPANGAVVTIAPAELHLEFNGPVQLLKVEVLHMGEHAMDIGFKPIADAKASFVLPLPSLPASNYTVNWSAIGADGHTVGNSFGFIVDPSGSASAGMNHGDGGDHHHDGNHDQHHEQNHGDAAGH